MPLLRHEVKNEYGLGKPELYRETPNREDPKALLDGLAVAGLVGILRQLGDLTEFAAEVFHGLQEEVMATASRSHKLMARMQSIEAALPPLEKAVLAQTSHLHFAYTSGSEWHPRIRNEKNHFIYNDLPRFVMDSYEECRDPPRLHLLDKFDIDGAGSCLKRYSDPVFFKRMSDDRKETEIGKTPKDRKSRKSKKKRSSRRREVPLNCATMSDHSGSMQYAQPIENGHASPYHTASSVDMSLKSDPDEHTYSFGLRNGLSNVECVFQLGAALQADLEYNECSSSPIDHDNISDSSLPDGEPQVTDDFPYVSSPEKIVRNSIRWDVKTEIAESKSRQSDGEETPELSTADYELSKEEKKHDDAGSTRRNTVLFADETTLRSNFSISQFEERQNDDGGSACREVVLFADETTLRSSFSLSEFEERQNDDSGSARRNTVVFADETTLRSNFRVSQLEEEHKDDGGNAHQNTVPVADESTRMLNISASQVENVESEPDDYVDALNTIESESETDLDCQTKHEVGRLYSDVSKEGVEDELNGTAYVSDEVSPKSESHAGSNFSSDKGAALELPSSVSLDNVVQTQTPETAVTHSVSDHVPDTESSISTDTVDDGEAKPFAVEPSLSLYRTSISPDTVDDAEVGHSVGEPSLSCSRTSTPDQPSGGRTLKAFCESQESQVEFSGGQPVAFWTNGGLLGLEPSKPPDFVVSSSARKDLTKRSENQAQAPNSQSWCGDQDGETDKCRDSNTISHEASQENDKIMSQFSLGHGSLGNGVRGNTPPMPDSGAKLDSSFRSGDHRSEYNGIHRTRPRKEFDEQFGCKRTEESLTSSPPLEHMKISFHPLDGFEASKLSLRFPDGSHSKEGTRDLFASFQLVPEPGISLQGLGSDDDDDTFCRSSPYNSDDNPSYETESDSEQWEHVESPGRKDNELYSSLGQISSLGFASGSLHLVDVRNDVTHLESKHKNFDTENGEGSLHSGSPLDLPCLDIMNSDPNREKMDKLNTLESCYLSPASPLPPPLPPVQWRLLKPPSDMEKDQQHATTEAHDHDESDWRPLGFTISQPSKQALNNQHSEAVAFTLKSKELEQQKLNLRKEAKTPAKGNVIDEKDEFLEQIRAKSFTLRPTTASKTLLTSGPAANDKVTAILKKANAIRQVVGSDEGEGDDSWSDS